MNEFKPNGLFYDALSGEFLPPSDPKGRRHTLARLAVATCQKGRGPADERDYIPSWANNTYAIVRQPSGLDTASINLEDTSVTIAAAVAKNPRIITFADFKPKPTQLSSGSRELIIGCGDQVISRSIKLGPELDYIKHEVSEIAQDFYNSYPTND